MSDIEVGSFWENKKSFFVVEVLRVEKELFGEKVVTNRYTYEKDYFLKHFKRCKRSRSD